MKQDQIINSDAYWDKRFSENWEEFGGPAQSNFFMRLAMESLPAWFLREMRKDELSISDWGCAQGDGTDLLRAYTDASLITGIDFSSVAIEQAKQRYPQIQFAEEDWISSDMESSAKPSRFDIVFSSNTLEHFHKPFEILSTLTKHADKAVVLALPYRESPLIDEHFFTFLPTNIPIRAGEDFCLIWSKTVNCRHLEKSYWPGEQIVLVFAKTSWLDQLKLRLGDVSLETDSYLQEQNRIQVTKLTLDNVQLSTESMVLKAQLDQTKLLLAEAQSALVSKCGELSKIQISLSSQQGELQIFQNAVSEIKNENAQLKSESNNLMKSFSTAQDVIKDLQFQVAEFEAQTNSINEKLCFANQEVEKYKSELSRQNLLCMEVNNRSETHQVEVASLHEQILQLQNERDVLAEKISCVQSELSSVNRSRQLERREFMHLSDWANRINSAPIRYGVKKALRSGVRKVFRMLPLDLSQKIALKQKVMSLKRDARIVSVTPQVSVTQTSQSAPIAQPGEILQLDNVAESLHHNSATESFDLSSLELNALLDKGRIHSRDVFVFSVIDWDFRIQRPQHIAKGFAKAGYRVFYFSNHFVDSDQPGFQIQKLDGNLELYQVKLHVKGAPPIYFAPPDAMSLSMLKLGMAQFISEFAALSSTSVIQHAYWYPLVTVLPNSIRCYDCMDHHEGFGNVPEDLIAIEKTMLSTVDLVITTSTWLEDFAKESNKNVVVIRNAGEYEHFSQEVTPKILPSGRRVIGYFGAIAEWFDVELIRKIAQAFPDDLVLLVGNDTINAKQQLDGVKNVEFTGEVAYAELPAYLASFDVCLLPFQVIPLTLATNPVKVYEYLAMGKPVVCVDLPEIAQFGDLVVKADTHDKFIDGVKYFLSEESRQDKAAVIKRQHFAKNQTWDHRVYDLDCAVKSLSLPKVSVVVLTYNNLELTEACLDSLIRWTDYPNLEIIVVDNASTDGSPDYLKKFKEEYPQIKLILSPTNLGFAAGNNLGLKEATGDYLVMLNNDTVVTPGWVMTMLRHFESDSDIGIVGPVTNNIGNEAKVAIEYGSSRQMLPLAVSLTLGNMGNHFEYTTAAFFCVMLPRNVFEQVGYLDENFGRGFFEDDDYCRRVQQLNMKIICAEDVFIHHHLSASFNKLGSGEKQALFEKNKQYYESKWGKWEPHVYKS